jgi:multidrug resistance protein MdtO
MGAIAQRFAGHTGRFTWFCQFLREELAPYRGRVSLVARMVLASTLAMIVCITFQIPYSAYAALFPMVLSRESLESTASGARALIVGSAAAGVYAIVGAMIALGSPMLRFLWVGGTLFLAFYVLSALRNYAAGARFAYVIVITIPLWDSHISGEMKVETTLWAVGAITIGSVITLLIEIIFAEFRRTDDLGEAITERLLSVEELLTCYADGREMPDGTRSTLRRLAMVGVSRLRQVLQRSGYSAGREQEMSAVVALVGRLVDLAASLADLRSQVAEDFRDRLRRSVENVAGIRARLANGAISLIRELPESDAPAAMPLLAPLETTVAQIYQVLTGAHSVHQDFAAPPDEKAGSTQFVPGALSNPEHVKFALRGCFAASLCYVIYNALFWPGIATSVTTCLLTALTTIGASHQKQFLRFTGAIVGGLVVGIGAQIFILPHIDSIGGFTILIAAVAALSAWIATSSPRLSYFGVQVVAAFYLVNLQEFKFQTSLVAARDRVVGILLGLIVMWLAFDVLLSAPAGVAMKKSFVSALRLLAELAREPVSGDTRVAIERSYALREAINAQFDNVRSLADGVLFEFGRSRHQNLMLREQIREWQPQLRTLFLMRIASWKYRLQLPGFELPDAMRTWQKLYDERSAGILNDLADRVEGVSQRSNAIPALGSVPDSGSFGALYGEIDKLTTSVAGSIATANPR